MRIRILGLSMLLIISTFGVIYFTASAQTPLLDDTPLTFPTPAIEDFEFTVLPADHAVVGMRPPAIADYDLEVFEDTSYTNFIEGSYGLDGVVDFVTLDKSVWASPPNRGAQVSFYSGSGNYQIEMENDYLDYTITDSWGGSMDITASGIEVLDAFGLSGATVGNAYTIDLTVPLALDLNMYLFDFVGDDAQARWEAPWSSENIGLGVSESITFVATITGDYLLVIINQNAGTGTYGLACSPSAVETLTVTGSNLAPANVDQWEVSIEMLQLNLVSSGSTNVEEIMVHLTGTGVDSDIGAVAIYHDANDNGIFNPGVDELLGRSLMMMGTSPVFFPNSFPVTSATPENLLIMYNIAPLATVSNTVGAALLVDTDITLDDIDTVNLPAPISSSTPTINAGAIPAINSQWQATAPTADGSYGIGEHILIQGTNAFNLEEIAGNAFAAWLIVENDGTNLYVTYDAIGDNTDDGSLDDSSFGLDTDNNDAPTLNADDQFESSTPDHLQYDGTDWTSVDLCTAVGLLCIPGFGPSPNSMIPHGIYEYQVPLALIGASPGDTLGFLSASDPAPGVMDISNPFLYDTWPQFIFMLPPLTDYGNLVLASAPGGDVLTVTGTPIASGTVNPGDTNIVMEQLTLTASANTIDVTDIRVDQTGTGVNADTGNIYLYHDVNDNGALDLPGDALLDTQTFAGPNTLTFTIAPAFTVTAGTPENLLIVFDIAVGATPGNTLRASLMSNTYITVTVPDTVVAFPAIHSNFVTIAGGADILTVSGTPIASGTVNPGDTNIVMEQLTMTASANTVDVTAIQIDQTGTGVDADTGNIYLYHDVNDNGNLDVVDILLDTRAFSGGTLTFSGFTFTVTAGIPENLLIVFDIAVGATPGDTLRASLLSNTYITVTAPDIVAVFAAIHSNFVTIAGGADILTVSGAPIASGTVNPGDADVVIEQLTLTAGSGSVDVTAIMVDQTGTGVDADTGSIYLYHDVNDNGNLDIVDILLDTRTFSGGTLTFSGLTFTVTAGTPESLLIVFDIAAGATICNTLRATLVSNIYVTVSAPDTVSSANFPINSNLVSIGGPCDVLTVSGTPKASGTVNPGDNDIVMEQLTLSASANTIDVTAIRVDQTGTGIDADTGNIKLYHDVNDDGNLDGGDLLLDTRTFSSNTLTFSGFTFTVTAGTPENLLIVFDIAAGATPGNTLRASLLSNTYITVTAPDSVAAFAAIHSNFVTIASPAGDTLTVTGIPIASGNVLPGDTNIVMEQLNLSVNANSATVTSIRIDELGTGLDTDTAEICLYDDVNDNGILNIGVDLVLDKGTFSSGTLTFSGLSKTVSTGTPENLLVVFNISATAVAGRTLQMGMTSNTYVTVSAPDVVSSANFPINSNTVTIQAVAGDILTVAGTAKASGNKEKGTADIVMEQLNLSVNANDVTVTDIKIDELGTAVDADTGNIKLYYDVNNDGALDAGDTQLGTTQTFASGALTFTGLSFTVSAGTPKNLLIVLAIATGATEGHTIQIGLVSASYITVNSPDSVSASNFPINSNTITITAPVADQKSDITGKVTDENGANLAGATVTLKDEDGETVATKTTDSDGTYTFSDIDHGKYSILITKSGYQDKTIPEFTLSANKDVGTSQMELTPVTPTPGKGFLDEYWWIIVAIVVIIVVLLIVALLMRRKKKPIEALEMPPEGAPPEGPPAPPGAPTEAPPPPP